MLGVLGGMGPAATVDFLGKLVAMTDAVRDQDHLPTIVYSVPQIPDRGAAILNGAETPLPALAQGLACLEGAGASVIAMPCNTAHYWHVDLANRARVPILHIVDAVIGELGLAEPSRIGLLATTATLRSGLYRAGLAQAGHEILLPDDQAGVMSAIQAVKAARFEDARSLLTPILAAFRAADCRRVILGCTELPIVLTDADGYFLDATAALVRACIRHFGRPVLATARE